MNNKKINKKVIFFGILLIFSFFSVYWILSKKSSTPIITPTPIPIKFGLLKTNPTNGIGLEVVPTTAVEFIFSKEVDVSSLVITSTPSANLSFETSESLKALYIREVPYWEINKEYIIKIDVKSKDGDTLDQTIEYPLKFIEAKSSNLIEKFQ
ncbi:hypothetical protein ACFL1Q_00845 [Patescibacteria group bacterium]